MTTTSEPEAPRGWARPWLVFLLAALWLGLESVALGPFSYVQTHDCADGYLPYQLAMASGKFGPRTSLWLTSMACGSDRVSGPTSLAHLSSWLFLLLPGWLAHEAIVLLQAFLCSWFAYRLARDRLGLSEAASVFAGLAAAVRSDLTVGFQGGYALFPFVLWSLEKTAEVRARTAWAMAALLGLLYASCSTFAHTLPFCLLGAAMWFVIVRRQWSPRFWALFAVFCLSSVAPHLRNAWAMALNAGLSQRADWSLDAMQATGLARACFVLKTEIGVPIILLSLAGFAFAKGRDTALGSLLAATLACVLGAEALDAVRSRLSANGLLGVFSGFQISRLARLAPFFALMAASRSLDLLPARRWFLGATVLLLFAGTLQDKIARLPDWLYQGSYTANYASPVLKELASRREEPFRVATFTHGMFPVWANTYGLESVDGHLALYPRVYRMFWSQVISPLTAAEPKFVDIFDRFGNLIYLFFDDADRFPDGLPFSRFYRLPLLSLANAKYIISRHPLLDNDLTPIVAPSPWPKEDRKERLKLRLRENFFGKTHLYVYENKTVLPRAFLVRQARFLGGDKAVFEALRSAGARSLQSEVLLSDDFAPVVGRSPLSQGKVAIAKYLPDRIELSLDTPGPALLVVSNTFSPYWRCEADGVPKRIMPAYGVFWAVHLDAPARRVVFRYEPPYKPPF